MNKRMAGLLIMGIAALVGPRTLHAQCDADCMVLMIADGSHTFNCFQSSRSGQKCMSNTNSCRLIMCESALLLDADGRAAALASTCDGKVPVARGIIGGSGGPGVSPVTTSPPRPVEELRRDAEGPPRLPRVSAHDASTRG